MTSMAFSEHPLDSTKGQVSDQPPAREKGEGLVLKPSAHDHEAKVAKLNIFNALWKNEAPEWKGAVAVVVTVGTADDEEGWGLESVIWKMGKGSSRAPAVRFPVHREENYNTDKTKVKQVVVFSEELQFCPTPEYPEEEDEGTKFRPETLMGTREQYKEMIRRREERKGRRCTAPNLSNDPALQLARTNSSSSSPSSPPHLANPPSSENTSKSGDWSFLLKGQGGEGAVGAGEAAAGGDAAAAVAAVGEPSPSPSPCPSRAEHPSDRDSSSSRSQPAGAPPKPTQLLLDANDANDAQQQSRRRASMPASTTITPTAPAPNVHPFSTPKSRGKHGQGHKHAQAARPVPGAAVPLRGT